MATQDERNFSKGMDLDSDERVIAQGDYRYGRNGRSGTSDQDFVGSVESMRGNIERDLTVGDVPYSFPADAKCMGAVEDVKGQSIIYFLYSSELDGYRIIRYFLKEKIIRDVIGAGQSNSRILNFIYKIWNGKIVYAGDQEYVIWTDGVNPIRKIRLDFATAYVGIGLDEQYINFAKQPPQEPPITFATPSTVNTFTAGKAFQFATRYVYDDNSITTLSPYSNIQFINDVNQGIQVAFSSGHPTVKEIQVLVREGNGISGEGNTNPTWYVVSKIPRPSGAVVPLAYVFTNTELKEPVARIDSDKLFESIPELAGCMELSETNQVVLGDITEGKDNPVIPNTTSGITITNMVSRSTFGTNQTNALRTSPYSRKLITASLTVDTQYPIMFAEHTPYQNPFFIPYDESLTVPGNFLRLAYNSTVPETITARIQATITVTSTAPALTTFRVSIAKSGVIIATQDLPINGVTIFTFDIRTSFIQNDYLEFFVAQIGGVPGPNINADVSFVITSTSGTGRKCLKENTQPQIGIQYYDAELRSGGIIPLVSPPVTALNNAAPIPIIDKSAPYLPFQRVNIYNRPPIWASYYSICIKETNIEYGWYTITNANDVNAKTELTYSNTIRGFEPEAGDFVRFIGQYDGIASTDAYIPFDPTDPGEDYNEYQVEAIDVATKTITLNGIAAFNIQPSVQKVIIEVYRQKTVTPFYFEERFEPVGNPGSGTQYHDITSSISGEQAQSQANPTVVPAQIFVYGDSYTRYGDEFLIYSKSYNNGYESDYWNKGRPAIEITNGGSKRLINGLRWGGQLFPNTFVNNMSVFDSGNYASANQGFGIINALRLRGYTLKIIQEGNTSSAYLNRRNVTNADGSEQLVLTDSLITQINPSQQYQGTLHKGSVILYNDDLYFFDAINGLVIRDSENGQVAISDYGAQRYFRQLGELTRELGSDVDIYAGYDEKTKQLFITTAYLDPSNELVPETISFEEKSNRWKFFHDYYLESGDIKTPIDMYSKMGQNMFMSINGRIWESNELVDNNGLPVYLNFFGEDRDFTITGVSNIEPTKVKIFLTHSIHSNRIPNFVLLNILPSAMYPLGMESELKPANYALREGVYYADIKRDAFTKGLPLTVQARREQIASGRPLRGQSTAFKMTWEGNDYVVVFTSGIGVVPSELS